MAPDATAPARWPATGAEPQLWTSVPEYQSRRAREEASGRYSSAVPARIADLNYSPPPATAAALDDATVEIARFDAELGADLAPFASILLRSESVASSRIENLTASARAIFQALTGDHSRTNASLIAANTQAMQAAIDMSERLDAESILLMHRRLLEEHDAKSAGRWREEAVWIGVSSRSPIDADFVAPRHELVPAAIDDLVSFIARNDVPVLQHAALAHAQFETIHPFTDGNGRTGRALVHAMLRGKGLTRRVTVPVSSGLLSDVDRYHRALTSYRTGDPKPILESFVDATFLAISRGRRLGDDLRTIRDRWSDRLPVRRDAASWRVVELLLRQPVLTSAVLTAELGISGAHAARTMQPLVDAGIVLASSGHTRGTLWRAEDVLAALDDFASAGARR